MSGTKIGIGSCWVITVCLTACPSAGLQDGPGQTSTGQAGDDDDGTTGGSPGTSGDPSLTSAPQEEGSTAGALPEGEGCCDAHAGPGCNESAVQTCVCEIDASCCGFDWTAACSGLATSSCAATCSADPDDTTTGRTSDASGGDSSSGTWGSTGFGEYTTCCLPHGELGCMHEPTQTCVCGIETSCCDTEWTEACVAIATESCSVCNTDDCCAPQSDAGCSDETIQTCVCELDAYCCGELWDEICIDEAVQECGATCVTREEPPTPRERGSTSE